MTSTSTRSDFVRTTGYFTGPSCPKYQCSCCSARGLRCQRIDAAVRMVGVEHFRSAVHQPPLDRIAEIAARNRRRHIAEGIGAVGHRLVLESEILVLQMHLIDAERLAAIVQWHGHPDDRHRSADRAGAGSRPSCSTDGRLRRRSRDRTARTHGSPVRTRYRYSPASRSWLPATGPVPERIEILRALRFHDEGAEETQHGQLTVMAVGVKLPYALPASADGCTTRTPAPCPEPRWTQDSSSWPACRSHSRSCWRR